MVMVIHSGTVPTWPASQPSVPDFSCGFQFHFSSGQRSKTLRVFFISSSNSDSMDCPMVMTISLNQVLHSKRRNHRRRKSELSSTFFGHSHSATCYTLPPPAELR